jgi:exosortase C (VPDSG-CTERM-specific)
MRNSSAISNASTPQTGLATGVNQRPKTSGPARPIAYAAFTFILGLAFIRPFVDLIGYAVQTDLYSHILLIPFISAYLILIQRAQLPKDYTTSLGWALILSFCGLLTLISVWISLKVDPPVSQNDYLSLTTFSFICLLLSGGFLFLGGKWMAAAAFPLGFLVFMVPLPDRALHFLETASQVASTEAAAIFFSITGTPMLRDGSVFQLPGIAIQVAQECSGIRSSWVLFITTLAASYLFLKSPCRRAILIAFVIPLAIVRNGFRIWVIGVLCVEIGPHMIDSAIHHQGGPIFFALSLIPLFLLLWWLRRGERTAAPGILQVNTVGRDRNGTSGLPPDPMIPR